MPPLRFALALPSGFVFGLGLIAGGMADPAKVKGFLVLRGAWDPSLDLVTGGAIGPARVAVSGGLPAAWIFVPAMLAGMALYDRPFARG